MRESSKVIGYTLLAFGMLSLILSIFYEHVIMAFIGLGLTFWGALLLFIRSEEYVKEKLLNSTMLPTLTDINQVFAELGYQGKGIYLPPKYFKNTGTSKVYITQNKNTDLLTPEEIQQHENKLFIKNPEAALITPPGYSLSKLFEKTLGKSFAKTDLEYLQQKLPKIFIEDLEIAENLEIQIGPSKAAEKVADSVSLIHLKYDIVHVKITGSIYKDLCKEARKLSHVCGTIGCPICSAIACAIAEASGNPVTIEKTECTEDGKVMEAHYRILED